MTVDDKSIYICRAPGCGIPFTNPAGRRSHETNTHKDICDSFKGKKGEILYFKTKALRDKAKAKIRADIKKAKRDAGPTSPPPLKKEPPTKPPQDVVITSSTPAAPPSPAVPPVTTPTPPATKPEKDTSHHNPEPKKKKGFWKELGEWLDSPEL